MAWISLFLLIGMASSQELPKLLTKHATETLRYISMDGRTAYVQRRPGVLGLVSSFRSVDFISDASSSDFIVTGGPDKARIAIEVVPQTHTEYNLLKAHKIHIVNWGNSQAKEIGSGRSPRLHLKDEWITYYDAYERILHVQNIPTQKKYEVKLSRKANPFFTPEAVMVASDNVTYTDVNESGYSALISYNLATKKSAIVYRSPQTGTKLELCRSEGYLAIGEFPYEGLNRGSKILQIKLSPETNLAGYSTIYSTVDQDLGNMICRPQAVYFIKANGQNKVTTTKTTDVVRLDLKNLKVEAKSAMGNVTQLIEMDGRVMVPFRGDFLVVEGTSNLGSDTLKSVPSPSEELPLEI